MSGAPKGPVAVLAGFPLLRRSEHEVVIVKPADLPSEMSADRDDRSVVARLRKALPGCEVELPHRLDRPTRGLLVAALSRDAIARHNEHVRARRWRKFYLARVAAGASLVGEHRAYLRRRGRLSTVVRSGGDPSHLEVLAEAPAPQWPGQRHLLIRLDTGRYHQIRVMCAELGFPLTGDQAYGGRPGSFYLEHALLELIDLDRNEPARVFWADDPQREAISADLASALASIAASG